MKNLDFNTSYKEYSINGDTNRVLRIKTTDMNILSRIRKAEKQLRKIADDCSNITDNSKVVETITELDVKVREQIDFIFDDKVSDIIFGNTNCLSIAGGKPIFENFLDVVLPVIKEDISSEQQNLEKMIGKYTSKVPRITK
ncbi:MAG: hypothetical protein SO152_03645 [Ruminococcus sp.]|nr:hypothetical protein [Ruminococcus sp.]